VFKREKALIPVKSTQPSVHEQSDGVILAACATGTSSRDSLLSWVRLLQESNPRLGQVPVVFTSRSPMGAVVAVDEEGRPNVPGPTKPTPFENDDGDKGGLVADDEVPRPKIRMRNLFIRDDEDTSLDVVKSPSSSRRENS
jgi:hypothetical protein